MLSDKRWIFLNLQVKSVIKAFSFLLIAPRITTIQGSPLLLYTILNGHRRAFSCHTDPRVPFPRSVHTVLKPHELLRPSHGDN